MKTISSGLATILDGNQFIMADLFTFTLAGGTVLRYSSFETDLTANGFTFPKTGLKFMRGTTHQATGLEVDTMALDIYVDPTDTSSFVNGVPFQAFVRNQGLDGAIIQVDRCFMAVAGDCVTNGTMLWFVGRASDITPGRTKIQMTVKSLLELLNISMPRDIYQPGCRNTLYNPDTCGLIKANFLSAGVVSAGSTVTVINSNLSQVPGYFGLGTIEFTSGLNSGVKRTVRSYVSGQFTLYFPLPIAPSPGDTFNAFPGCDLTQGTCTVKFNNLKNFRGEPNVPAPETAR